MNKEKQIEEIKKTLIKTCKKARTTQEDYLQDRYAEALYNAGYRKVKHGEWNVNGDITECSNCHKEYVTARGMLQLKEFEHCPLCGAKMDGGNAE